MALPAFDELNLLHSNICQALGDPKRLQILYVLHEQSRHVTALADALDVPQPTVSRHLRVLRECGLVISERDGPAVYYSVTDERIIQVLDTMRAMLRDLLGRQSDILAN
jgi:ArsR family transcriptional regulator